MTVEADLGGYVRIARISRVAQKEGHYRVGQLGRIVELFPPATREVEVRTTEGFYVRMSLDALDPATFEEYDEEENGYLRSRPGGRPSARRKR